ncbi:hypothetical protein [Pontivivens ytuae]|uniref:Uncharacterized protein n=1 Tax=Pontivivens ytuae TaxID=2789856 RepID=A0A7S9LT91_9RHOB|nr:hypothetical protein [Pontivivens ytuae]QPH54731.1 hypothetical protein I0K15_02835 [Pontivivens ytuae]
MSARASLRIALVAATLAAAPPASAQMFMDTSIYQPDMHMLNMDFMNQNIRNGMGMSEIPAQSDSAPMELAFTPDPVIRQQVIDAFVTDAVNGGAPEAAALWQMDVFGALSAALRPYGLETTDLGDAMTAYMIELHDAANLRSSDPSAATVSALRAQIEGAFAADGSAPVSAAERQRQSDRILLQAAMISGAKDVAMTQAPPEQRDAFQQAMVALGRDMYGLDLRDVALGANGFALQ